MSKYNSRLVALFLAIVMVLNIVPVTGALGDIEVKGETKRSVTELSDMSSYDLYNIAKINNKYYRLRKSSILVKKPVLGYVGNRKEDDHTSVTVPVGDYDVEPYDFEHEIIIYHGKEYTYATDHSGDALYTNHYTAKLADEKAIIVAVRKKIGGLGDDTQTWVVKDGEYDDPNETDSFHRDYAITLYTAQTRKYKVRFVNWNESLLKEMDVVEGNKPSYNNIPSRQQTDEYKYVFDGWYDPTDDNKTVYKPSDLPAVHGEVTYVAAYTPVKREYTITWKHEDGTRIDQTQVAYGEKPTHKTPDKLNPDERYTYEFKGWNPEITEDTKVTKNAEYKAVFSSTPKLIQNQPLYYMLKTAGPGSDGKYYRLQKRTITAKDISLAEVGKNVPETDYEGPVEYDFTDVILTVNDVEYEHRDHEITADELANLPDGYDAYYTTKFDRVVRKLQINEDSTWFGTEAGWLDNAQDTYSEVKNDIEAYHADYIATLHPGTKQYTITFETDGGTEIEPITQVAGSVVRAPAAPTKPGYTFTGWDTEDGTVPGRMPKGGATLTAQWKMNDEAEYTVEYYYQKYGTGYVLNTALSYTDTGKPGEPVSAEEKSIEGFIYDTNNPNNKQSAEILLDGSLVLKRYYNSVPEPLYTLITYKDPKNNQEKWYGIEYQSTVNIINSRLVAFEHCVQPGEFDITDFDFVEAKLVLEINGVKYWPAGSQEAESGDYPYYEWSRRRIQKVNHTDATNGLLNGADKTWMSINGKLGEHYTKKQKEDGWNKPGNTGLPYRRGFWHRDYDITLHDAQPKPAMTLTAEGYSGTYDGATHKVKVTAPDGSTIKYSVDRGNTWTTDVPGITDAGEVTVKIQATHSDYKTGTAEVTLKLAKAELTVTTGSDSRAYDGKPLTKDEAGITGLVNNETATVTATGSITDYGSATNTYSITWGTAKAANYKITENLGTLTITKATMSLTVTGYEGTYDGATHSVAVNAPEGSTIEYSVDGGTWTTEVPGITDAGEATVRVRVTNSNYEDGAGEATLTLAKAPVTVTTGGGERVYNGAALTNTEAGITGLVNGETATVTATGVIMNAGSAVNTYGIAWGTAKAENYEITENLGTLEVTPRTVTLTSASDSKAYDGGALTRNAQTDVTVGGDGFVAGESASYTITGRQTTVGESQNTFVYTLNPGTLTRNYNITPYYGTLTVVEAEDEGTTGGLPGGGLPGTDLPGGGTETGNTPEGGNTAGTTGGTTGGRGVQNYTLTITYQTDDGTLLDTFTRTYANGQQYEVRSPDRAGYTVNIDTVFGTINGEDVTRTVIYSPAVYTLTIYVQSIANGMIVSEPIVRRLSAGEAYNIPIPGVNGYSLLTSFVEGTMPASNREITVFAIPAGTTGGRPRVIQIEDYGTPLGIAESILGSGEIIE